MTAEDFKALLMNHEDGSKVVIELTVTNGMEEEALRALYNSLNAKTEIAKGMVVNRIFFGTNSIERIAETAKTDALARIDEAMVLLLKANQLILNEATQIITNNEDE